MSNSYKSNIDNFFAMPTVSDLSIDQKFPKQLDSHVNQLNKFVNVVDTSVNCDLISSLLVR